VNKTTYLIQPVRHGRLQRHHVFDDEELALQAACVLLHMWALECDRATKEMLSRLWRESKHKEEIRTWNTGRFDNQIYVFQITVDSPSESFEQLTSK